MTTPSAVRTLLALFAVSLGASAGPLLRIDTSLQKPDAAGTQQVLAQPTILVENGKPAVIRSGDLEYALTPTLLNDGIVDIRAIITQHQGEKPVIVAKSRLKIELGKSGGIQFRDLTLHAQPSLAR